MEAFALVMTNTDIRPRMDVTDVALFSTREAAEKEMEAQIVEAVDSGFVEDVDIERHPDLGFACSCDGRLMWKIVRRRVESVS